ncbi:hypothetical protein [Saccharothrix syringae]|uniref:hypothetical protein n=1 Tax=Saccharothrix syringae TaxID=103733 RepID=UPI001292D2C4|nr:hypothetical protein [Saccharothrix syringae]
MTGSHPTGRQPDEVRVERRRLLLVHVRIAAVSLGVLIVLVALSTVPATAVLGTALLVAAAATACGALTGFLFGIPRIPEDRAQRGDGTTALSANTNLEQISDWLTKILVGVGLVQVGAIGDAAGRLVDTIATAFQPAKHATVLAGALVVLPTVLGFLVSYIGARTWLMEMFTEFDGGIASFVRSQVNQALAPVQAEVDQVQQDQRALRELLAVVDAQLDSRGPEPRLDTLADLLAKATPAQREYAFRSVTKVRRSPSTDDLARRRTIPVLRALVDADPGRYAYRAELGSALADVGEHHRALAELDQAIALRGAPTKSDWFEFHRARARLGTIPPTATPDPETAALLRDDLAVAWRKPSFRAYLTQVLTKHADNPEHQVAERMLPYLPPDVDATTHDSR